MKQKESAVNLANIEPKLSQTCEMTKGVMADTTHGAQVFSRSPVKPEIYKTVDGKIIVEDELLNFLAVKIKTLSQDETVLLATNTFDSKWTESSNKM